MEYKKQLNQNGWYNWYPTGNDYIIRQHGGVYEVWEKQHKCLYRLLKDCTSLEAAKKIVEGGTK